MGGNLQSCNPILLMSTPSIKIFPDVASRMRNSARSSWRDTTMSEGGPMHLRQARTQPRTFQHPSFQQYQSSPLVSDEGNVREDTPREGTLRTIVNEILFNTGSSSGRYLIEYSLHVT